MDKMSIAFPNLNIYLDYVPKSFTIGGFTIALYGVIIAIGVLAGFTVANADANRQALERDICWDFALPAIVFSVVGARMYYVAFRWEDYANDLKSILNIRQGGIAIYGAVIGGFLALLIFSKVKRVNFLRMADSCCLGLLLGQAIGRWGNFTNREVFGEYTDGLFAMRIPVEMVRASDISVSIASHLTVGINYIQVHPTFLYESALNLVLFFLLWKYSRKKKFAGEIAVLYLGGYGIIRFFIEGIRTDQLLLPGIGLPVSQMLGLVCFILAFAIEALVRVLMLQKNS